MSGTTTETKETLPHVIPFVHPKQSHRGTTMSFSYTVETTETITKVTQQHGKQDITTTETVTKMWEQKGQLKTFGQTAEEDVEDLFETLFHLRQELHLAQHLLSPSVSREFHMSICLLSQIEVLSNQIFIVIIAITICSALK